MPFCDVTKGGFCSLFPPKVAHTRLVYLALCLLPTPDALCWTLHIFGRGGRTEAKTKHVWGLWPLTWEWFLCPSWCHKGHVLLFIAHMRSQAKILLSLTREREKWEVPFVTSQTLVTPGLFFFFLTVHFWTRDAVRLFTKAYFSRMFTFKLWEKIKSVSLKLCHTVCHCGKKKRDYSEIQRVSLGHGKKKSLHAALNSTPTGVFLLPLAAREDYLWSSVDTFGEKGGGGRRWKHQLGLGWILKTNLFLYSGGAASQERLTFPRQNHRRRRTWQG